MDTNITMINRDLTDEIKKNLNSGKVLVLYGPRQVGKTTLLKNLFPEDDFLYLSCEQARIKSQLIADSLVLKDTIGKYKNIVLDEAQHLENPGLTLKVLIDNFPDRNFLASGSSSFELANKLSEPLTGRYFKFLLTPLTLSEVKSNTASVDFEFQVNQSLIFGLYPDIYKFEGKEEKIRRLTILTDSYLYSDVLTFNLVKDSKKVRELLITLAFQIGSEVSYSELAAMVGIDRKTVEYYLDLLEKTFVLFRIYGFSRNLRSEINRKVKIYFYDLGVRNSLINNFNDLNLRNDGGGMFENFIVSEMVKKTVNDSQKTNFYFWRTYRGQEVDLISEKNGKLNAYEIKLGESKRTKGLHDFKAEYPKSKIDIITMNNYRNYF